MIKSVAVVGAILSYSLWMSDNFSYKEFVHSDTANRYGILNEPEPYHIENGKALFLNVLQPIRDKFGRTIVTSGYRNEQLNRLVKGVDDSQHMNGEAVDFYVPGYSLKQVCEWIDKNLEYDQLILEPSWIHVSYSKSHNRKEFLVYKKGKLVSFYK